MNANTNTTNNGTCDAAADDGGGGGDGGDRVAVVTGGNKGIGYFIALQLGLSGLFRRVLLGCRDETRGLEAAKRIQSEVPSSSVVEISSLPLILDDEESRAEFAWKVKEKFGRVDCLINNAAIAFKRSDPTPFQEQAKPTLDVNFRGTVDLTERLLPLIRKGTKDPRIVNVASTLGRLQQVSAELQSEFRSESLTIPRLGELVDSFERDVAEGTHEEKGWSDSCYGVSKLALIAATRVWARQEPGIAINSCCPGFCKTDMTGQKGFRDAAEGAKNAVIPATMENPPTGEFFAEYKVSQWDRSMFFLALDLVGNMIFGFGEK